MRAPGATQKNTIRWTGEPKFFLGGTVSGIFSTAILVDVFTSILVDTVHTQSCRFLSPPRHEYFSHPLLYVFTLLR